MATEDKRGRKEDRARDGGALPESGWMEAGGTAAGALAGGVAGSVIGPVGTVAGAAAGGALGNAVTDGGDEDRGRKRDKDQGGGARRR